MASLRSLTDSIGTRILPDDETRVGTKGRLRDEPRLGAGQERIRARDAKGCGGAEGEGRSGISISGVSWREGSPDGRGSADERLGWKPS